MRISGLLHSAHSKAAANSVYSQTNCNGISALAYEFIAREEEIPGIFYRLFRFQSEKNNCEFPIIK